MQLQVMAGTGIAMVNVTDGVSAERKSASLANSECEPPEKPISNFQPPCASGSASNVSGHSMDAWGGLLRGYWAVCEGVVPN
jgi:hypothetical protein